MNYKGYTININIDKHATNPRKWLNLGTLITCDSFNEVKSDILKSVTSAVGGGASIIEELEKHFGNIAVYIPVYKDKELRGFMFATKVRTRYWFNTKYVTKTIKRKAIKELMYEVIALEHFIGGHVYEYHIVELGLKGFGYFSEDACIREAQSLIDEQKGLDYEYERLFKQVDCV